MNVMSVMYSPRGMSCVKAGTSNNDMNVMSVMYSTRSIGRDMREQTNVN